MNRSYRLPTAVILLSLLVQVTACQPDSAPEPVEPSPAQPSPAQPSPTQPTDTPEVQTSPFSLTSPEPDTSTDPKPPGNNVSCGVLTTGSALGSLDFRYDAYVVTARESGSMTLYSDVIAVNPAGYRYGYGYPLSMAAIEDGVTLAAYGGNYVQNALETGTAIIQYPVLAGRQYILVYKTFGSFTPLTYCLTLPEALTLEGRIHALPQPVTVPTNSAGLITLENPRPDVLNRFVPWLSERVKGN
ncbi:hypothetical protein [Hyalangium rubrum]|uniref:Lipoprotein n=1 Tax=Hyalangium rubrum TaxID=3103134 RepID=A0ABU5GZV1_9BACT|nr:hypothetical protein [Hyalangium sp. s54d21]MDY7226714.1 hypothetical protein [Hyalangium sp. s54d21]